MWMMDFYIPYTVVVIFLDGWLKNFYDDDDDDDGWHHREEWLIKKMTFFINHPKKKLLFWSQNIHIIMCVYVMMINPTTTKN